MSNLDKIKTMEDYIELLNTNYFNLCHNKTVLELGPHNGYHTKLIINNQPKYLELIEGYEPIIDRLKKINGIDNVVVNDIMLSLQNTKVFDVVVCFGVLYHLHSPLHLIELIVNNCKPSYIMLDCVNDPSSLQVLPEDTDTEGNRQSIKGWKSSKFNLVVPYDIINKTLNSMGYITIQHQALEIDNFFSKSNSWVALWKLSN